ncbi:hypothetical protein C9F11_10280 [Streptomyces sp. YIM 121038]|nr:hypothetical protein C9F11_10280 [Streptomyces sp. YIM 121038]
MFGPTMAYDADTPVIHLHDIFSRKCFRLPQNERLTPDNLVKNHLVRVQINH